MQSLPDLQLLQLLENGNKLALGVLYDRYWEMLFDAAYNMIREEEPAKDIVQEIFIQLWNKNNSTIKNLKPYLMQIVKYQSYRYIRRANRHDEFLSASHQYLSGNYTEEQILLEELNESLREIVKKLPDRCREIFYQSRFENLSNRQIAEKLDIRIKTVENQLNKALKIIRHSLATFFILFFY